MFLWTWKDLYNTFRFDGLSHVHSRQFFFLLICSDNESLISAVPLPTPFPRHPPLLSSGCSSRVGMLCWPFHRLSQSHGDPLTCCLPGAQVSDSTSHRAVVWVVLQTPLEVIVCTRCDNVNATCSWHNTISSSHRDKTVLQLSSLAEHYEALYLITLIPNMQIWLFVCFESDLWEYESCSPEDNLKRDNENLLPHRHWHNMGEFIF